MSQEASWGVLSFRGVTFNPSTYEEPLRAGQRGIVKVRLADYSGGLIATAGIHGLQDLNKIWRNEGLQTRLAGLGILPYALTTQASLQSVDASGYVAANKRAHSALSALGTTGLRWYAGVGPYLIRDTSLSNAALVVADTLTNGILAVREMVFNSTQYLVVATDGTTDDTKGTADPTASPPSWTSLITQAAGDGFYAMEHFPNLGPGVNVFAGDYGTPVGLWWCKATDSVPVTLREVVHAATKDSINTGNTVLNTGAVAPTAATFIEDLGPSSTHANPTNVFVSDNAYATGPTNAALGGGGSSLFIVTGGYGFSSRVPASAEVTGVLFQIERAETHADVNAKDRNVYLQHSLQNAFTEDAVNAGFTAVGHNKADEVTEWPTSDTTKDYGGAADKWGADITAELVRNDSFGGALRWSQDAVASEGARVDYMPITVYYRLKGTQIKVAAGGFGCITNPAAPETMMYVQPAFTQVSAITVPRGLWRYDLEWDPDGERVVATPSRPNTGMAYIHAITPFSGGWAIAGGAVSGPGRQLKLIDTQGQLRDFAFPGVHGSTEVRINNLWSRGSWLVIEVVNADFSDRQIWYWYNGRYYPDNLLQSKSATGIATQPVPFSTAELSLHQSQLYSLFPVSTTHLAGVRQFLPEDPGADPRLVDTAQVKSMAFVTGSETASLKLTGPEIDWGPEEAHKVLLAVSYQGRRISGASSTYGSATLEVDTGGDQTVASAEVTREFTAAFEEYDVPSSGVAYRTMIPRIGLKHEAGTAKTPDALPLLLTALHQGASRDDVQVLIDAAGIAPDFATFVQSLYDLQETKGAQVLTVGDKKWVAEFAGMSVPRAGAQMPPLGSPVDQALLTEEDRKGEVQAIPIILRFRSLPGATS